MKTKLLNYIRSLRIKLLHSFDMQLKVDNLAVRRSMDKYFHFHDWSYKNSITKVEVYEGETGMTILIETHMPGMLIDKGGIFIDGLHNWFKIEFNRDDIEIKLKECMLWYNLYDTNYGAF